MKILVRTPNWLGDLVMSSGFFNKLSGLFPESKIHVIVKEELSGLMPLFRGIHKVYPYSKGKYNGLPGIYRFAKEISNKEPYDIFFCLPDSFSSALMGYFIGSKARIGYRKELRSFFFTNPYRKPKGIHRAEEYAFLLSGFSPNAVSALSVRLDMPSQNSLPDGLIPGNGIKVVLNINSWALSRRMSLGKWASISNELIRRLNCNIILIGTEKEKFYTDNLVKLIPASKNVIDLSGKITLYSLVSVLKKVDLMISTDSGPAHLANGLGIDVIVLFGAGDERNTAPYNRKNLCIVKADNIKCAPCVSNACKFGKLRCLEEIKEQKVVEYTCQMLKGRVTK